MKKILSVILTASMLITSAALPAFAENGEFELAAYSSGTNDVVRVEKITYESDDSATETNTIDNSKAKKFGKMSEDKLADRVFKLDNGTDAFTSDFFLTFDFRFDTISDATPGIISISRVDDNTGRNFKQGPRFRLVEGQLVTNTDSSHTQKLGEISADTWYTAEIEGQMTAKKGKAEIRVYKYSSSGEKTLAFSNDALNLRQFAPTSDNNGCPNHMYVSEATVDNIELISLYPDTVNITTGADTIETGESTTIDYTLTRNGKETIKHSAVYSIYDAANTNPVTDGVTIQDGSIIVAQNATPQTITIRADSTSPYGNKVASGTKQLTIAQKDISGEKFKSIAVSGADEMRAGTTETFTATAKDHSDADAVISDGDIKWGIYNCDDQKVNANPQFSISDKGVLTVSDDALPQEIYVRASTPSGAPYGSHKVKINMSEKQIETVLSYNACETAISNATRVDSVDGSSAYQVGSSGWTAASFSGTKDYVYTELDIKIPANASQFLSFRGGGKYPMTLTLHNGKLAAYSGKNYSDTVTIDPDKWYHLEMMFSLGKQDFSMNVYEYDSEGNRGEKQTFTGLTLRQTDDAGSYATMDIGNTITVDNIKVTDPIPETTLSAARATMYAGETNKLTAAFTKNGMPIKKDYELTYFVTDEDGEQINSNLASVSGGELKVSAMAQDQKVKVAAYIGTDKVAETTVEIKSAEIFTVEKIGIKYDDDNVIEKLYVNKKLFYQDEVVFTMAFYDDNDKLIAVRTFKSYGKNLATGTVNPVTVNWDIPEGFNTTDGKASVFIWTAF